MLSASIIIRTKNEARFLAETLRLVSDQTHRPQEIIVVDSGSTDGTVEIVRQRPGVKLIEIPAQEFTFGRALNIGMEAAEGRILVSLSAHAFPKDLHWLEHLTKHFNDPTVAAVYGRQLPHRDAWPPVRRDYANSYGPTTRSQVNPDLREDYFFSNANAAIRRDLWQQRRFDETLPAVEDQEWCRSILRSGRKVIYEPKAAVYHSHNESLLQLYRRSFRESWACKLLFNWEHSRGTAWRAWLHAIKEDAKFVLSNAEHRNWLLWIPIYRFFWVYGNLTPYLPELFWQPLQRCWVRARDRLLLKDRG